MPEPEESGPAEAPPDAPADGPSSTPPDLTPAQAAAAEESASAMALREERQREAELALSTTSKTDHSQQLKGNQSYYYWHSDAERRRQNGEKAVPAPAPKPLRTSEEDLAAQRVKRVSPIQDFSFLDDDDTVKVYIPLKGELVGTTMDNAEVRHSHEPAPAGHRTRRRLRAAPSRPSPTPPATLPLRCQVAFGERTLQVDIEQETKIHRFVIDRLCHKVDPSRCSARVLKTKGKMILTLHKQNHIERWSKLRGQ